MPVVILSIIALSLLLALLYERNRHQKREGELLNLCLRASGMSAISLDTSEPAPVDVEIAPKERKKIRFAMPAIYQPSVPPLSSPAAKESS